MKNFKIFSRTTLNIDQNSFNSGTISINDNNTDVVITEDITIDNVNEYLDLQGDNITIDGKGYTITVKITSFASFRYPGFIKNGDNNTNAPCANCTIKNINVAEASLYDKHKEVAEGGGWIGQKGFGNGISNGNILFENCSSSGSIGDYAGGISGNSTGKSMDNSTITFKYCYSTGNIGDYGSGGISGSGTGKVMTNNSTIIFNNCYSGGTAIGRDGSGGISGKNTGKEMKNNSTITFNNCYSVGTIGNNGSGGISGSYTGNSMQSSSTITANNCYTIGNIGTGSGGIYGDGTNASATESNCITSASSSQTAGTWIDANAASTIGTSTTNNDVTDVWTNKSSGSPWTHRLPVPGCTDSNAFNYDNTADIDDGNCVDKVPGCTDVNAFNYDSNANTDDGNCVVLGCTDVNAFNYDSNANTDDGNCVDKVLGCMDVNALNYDSNADTDDGNCEYPEPEINNVVYEFTGNSGNKYYVYRMHPDDKTRAEIFDEFTAEGYNPYINWDLFDPVPVQNGTVHVTTFDGVRWDWLNKTVAEAEFGEVSSNAKKIFVIKDDNKYRETSHWYSNFTPYTTRWNIHNEKWNNNLIEGIGSDYYILLSKGSGIKCNDPEACNYNYAEDCKYLDCAGICGGKAEKIGEDCILSYKM